MQTLTWSRRRAGLYTSGPFTIERLDARYGPTWILTVTGDKDMQVRRPTLHQCQAIAGTMAVEVPLLTYGVDRAAAPGHRKGFF